MYTYSKIAKSSKIKLIRKSFEGRVILCTPSTPPPHTHTHTHTHTHNAQVLIFFWPVPLLVKTDAAIFEVNMSNHSQDIIKSRLFSK